MQPLDGRQVKVGVLGATGTVGQRFIVLLTEHPFFTLHALGASARSAGKPYAKAVHWKQTTPIPAVARELVVHECAPQHFAECSIVFSGLDADAAGDIGVFAELSSRCFVILKSHLQKPHFAMQNWLYFLTQKTLDEIPMFPSSFLSSTPRT